MHLDECKETERICKAELMLVKAKMRTHMNSDKSQRKLINFRMTEANRRADVTTDRNVPLASKGALKCFHGDGETSRQLPKVINFWINNVIVFKESG